MAAETRISQLPFPPTFYPQLSHYSSAAMKHIYPYFLSAILTCCLLLCNSCSSQKSHYVIGVSQCSDDAWRTQMNKEILREALFYPDVQIIIKTAKDNNQQQIDDIKNFIQQKIDLLIVAPNEAEAITPIVEEAFSKGIPVVLVDRKIHSDQYTAYIGADNYSMGQQIGAYIARRLHGKGNIVELTGLKGSTPAEERHKGLTDVLARYPDINIVATSDAGWFQKSAMTAFDSILNFHPQIDLVFAHNDLMAAGAHEAAARRHQPADMLFIGVDALTGKDLGVELVSKGILDASFIYPTGGDKALQVAMSILRQKAYKRENILSTALVNKSNAYVMQMQASHINTLDEKIELLDKQIEVFQTRYSAQQMFLYACFVIIVLIVVLLVLMTKAYWTKRRMNSELSAQKRQLEQQRDQLIELSGQLKKATHDKLAFFTNISHDFRTPLTLITDPVNQLLESSRLNKHERFLLNIVSKNVTVLLRLVNQIMDFRKYESGKLNLQISHFNLAQSIHEWADAFKTLSYRKHIRFGVQIEGDKKDYEMTADSEKLERITYNLLSNAFKFTPDNGHISIRLSTSIQGPDRWLEMNVSDNGVGMPAEHIKHIFDSFYQIDVHHAGSGIGLALVKAFVEMHHGFIDVNSNEGQGTTFRICMPMKQKGNLSASETQNQQLSNLREGAVVAAGQENISLLPTPVNEEGKNCILIIDDNQDIRDYTKSILETEYTVIEAANGQEGIQQAMKYVPDAIICDVMMPVMDGMECCRRLKSELQTSHIPVMMLTAYAADEQKIEGYECGADSYISKPYSAKLLLTRLRNLIDNRKRLQDFFIDKTHTQKESLSDPDREFIDKLRNLIEQHLSDAGFRVDNMGDEIGLSRIQLYRKTKALTGYPPLELLRVARLKKAAQLMGSTEKTIAEIAYEVGFNSPSYFAKCYKEYFGENPTDFLKRNKS